MSKVIKKTSAEDLTISPSGFFNFSLKKKKIIFYPALVFFMLMLGYVLWGYSPQYTSHSAVLIKDSALKAKYLTSDPYETTSSVATNSVLNTMSLLNTEVVSDTVYDFLRTHYPSEIKRLKISNIDEWHTYFEDGSRFIKSKNKAGTDIIFVSFSWKGSPKIAKDTTTAVLDGFQKASREVNRSEQNERYIYLVEQYNQVKTELENIRHEISSYQESTKTLDITQEIVEITNTRGSLQNQLSDTLADASAKNTELQRFQASMGMDPKEALKAAAIGGNPTLSKLYDKYYQLSQDYAQISEYYTDESPQSSELLAQLKQTNRAIQQELSRMNVPLGSKSFPKGTFADEANLRTIGNMVEVQAEAAMLTKKAATIQGELAKLNQRLLKVPSIQERFSNLQQKESTLSESLKTLETKLLDSKMKEMQTTSNIFVIDPPKLPTKSDFPRVPHLLALSLFIGLAIGYGIVYLQWRSQKKLHPSLDELLTILSQQKTPNGSLSSRQKEDENISNVLHS